MLRRQLVLFSLVGVLGFVVDAGIVQLLVREFGADPYLARLVSFLAAASVTWACNRRYTFAGQGGASRSREWARYLLAMAAGFVLNYGSYAALVALSSLVCAWPAIGVAVGSVAGGVLNFLTSKYWIFRADAVRSDTA